MNERRSKQRRKSRTNTCRRCKGLKLIPTGEPDQEIPNTGGEVGTPVKKCSCVENKNV